MAPLPLHRRIRRTDDLDTVPLHVGDERRYVGWSLGRRRQRRRPGGLAEPGLPEVLGESFRALDRQLHEGMVAAGFGDVRPAHYAVFRFLKPGGRGWPS